MDYALYKQLSFPPGYAGITQTIINPTSSKPTTGPLLFASTSGIGSYIYKKKNIYG